MKRKAGWLRTNAAAGPLGSLRVEGAGWDFVRPGTDDSPQFSVLFALARLGRSPAIAAAPYTKRILPQMQKDGMIQSDYFLPVNCLLKLLEIGRHKGCYTLTSCHEVAYLNAGIWRGVGERLVTSLLGGRPGVRLNPPTPMGPLLPFFLVATAAARSTTDLISSPSLSMAAPPSRRSPRPRRPCVLPSNKADHSRSARGRSSARTATHLAPTARHGR